MPALSRLVVVALAGCGGGAYVEVHTGGLDVSEVELVTGNGSCRTLDGEKCTQIIGDAAVGFTGPLGSPGDLYQRGPSGVAAVVDGVASFELDPAAPLEVAFAIGRDGQGQVIGVAVVDHTIDDTSGPVVYRVDLDPAESLFTEQRDQAKAGVTVWGTTDHCLGVAPIRPSPRSPIFILPKDNPDCDAIAGDPAECNPLWFDGMQFDEASAPHCVTRSTRLGTTGRTPCVLGHQPSCAEVTTDPNQMPCVETDSCLPDAVCSTVDACADTNEICQQSILIGTPSPRVTCAAAGAPVAADSQPCASPVPNTLDLSGSISDPIIKVELIQPPQTGGFAPYHGQRTDQATFGQVEFKVTHGGTTLAIDRAGTGPANLAVQTILVVTTKDALGNEHEIWIPISLSLSTVGCPDGNPIPCTFDGADDAEFVCGGDA